jgi:hypothetical protein
MKIGDLVICASVSGRPLGLIVEVFRSNHGNTQCRVKIHGHDKIYPFRSQNLETLNASR